MTLDRVTLVDGIMRFRRPLVVATHIVLIAASNYAAIWLRFDGEIPPESWEPWLSVLPLLIVVRAVTFIPLRLYEGLWRYTSIWDLRNLMVGVALSSAVSYVLTHFIWRVVDYPRSVYVIDAILLVLLLGGVRLGRRIYRELVPTAHRSKRVLVYGAGNAGEMIVRDLRSNPDYDATPIGFIDDDPMKRGQRIHGVQVLGGRADLAAVMRSHEPTEILIAIPSALPQTRRQIVRALETSKIRITTLPNLHELLGRPPSANQIRQLNVEDLLTRPPVGLSDQPLYALARGRRLLVTGAGGSIGSEICRQLARFGPLEVVALDRYENTLFALLNELGDAYPDLTRHGVIADVVDEQRMREVFATYRPDVVFHAAAHKHVPLMEANPCEAVKNNVRGSRLVAALAREYGVSRFILISTDKAVHPTSVMGATKRVAELAVREVGAGGCTQIVTVRFGNVLASNGSVVPRFLDQIRRGGPVTVTHPEVRRFFMLIPEAVQLVLHAATLDEQGHIYVLDMGEPIRLIDMARDLIRLSGYVPDEEIMIEEIGLRPGEKLEEELVGDDEIAEPSPIDKILRVRMTKAHEANGTLLSAVDSLEKAAAAGDRDQVLLQLSQIVPRFRQSPT
jgi:FlaA1/EpsC-like NDP-sugar epimerase